MDDIRISVDPRTEKAFRHDSSVLMEEPDLGETTVGFFQTPLPVVGVRPSGQFFDYSTSTLGTHRCPAGLPRETTFESERRLGLPLSRRWRARLR